MGNKHSHHHHHPPPPPGPSLAERRAHSEAQLAAERSNYQTFISETKNREQELQDRIRFENAQNLERQRLLFEQRALATEQAENIRRGIVRDLEQDKARLEDELKACNAEIHSCRTTLAQQQSHVLQLQGKETIEKENVDAQAVKLHEELELRRKQLTEVSDLLTKSQEDALASSDFTDESQRTFIRLQFLLHGLPQNADNVQKKLSDAAMTLQRLVNDKWLPIIQNANVALDTPMFPTATAAQVQSSPDGQRLSAETLSVLKEGAGMDAADLEDLFNDEESRKAFFPNMPLRDTISITRLLRSLHATTGAVLEETTSGLGQLSSDLQSFGFWRSEAEANLRAVEQAGAQAERKALGPA